MTALLLVLACSTAPDAPAGNAGPPPALVEVAEARGGTLDDTWTYLGEVRPLERAELAVGASGAITEVSVREGDTVRAGTLLVEVDPALAAAEVAAARADRARVAEELAQARRTLERLGRVEGGVLAANELESARSRVLALEAGLEGAEAAVQLASARLSRHRVRAPFDGVVARRHVDPGDWVDPGRAVLDLVGTRSVEILVEAPVELAGRVSRGDPAELRGATTIDASVAGVVPALDPVSRTAAMRLVPDETPAWLVPGTSVPVAFRVTQDGGVVVPRDALIRGASDERVYRVVDGVAESIVVRTLAASADEVLVAAESLEPGDSLVIRGNERLRPGQPVRLAQ